MAIRRITNRCQLVVLLALGCVLHLNCQAQWLTQSFELKAGWNAVFLNVDASYDTLDSLVGNDISNPILQVWRWNPSSTVQFSDSPSEPTDQGSEWSSWVRAKANAGFQRLVGDSAYLVNVGTNVTSYTWQIKGRPAVPRHEWSVTGLNFVGFSTSPTSPPSFESFLAKAPALPPLTTEIFRYVGGEMGPNNPVEVLARRATPVRRGEAFWMRNGTVFNRYFGPFEVVLTSSLGVDFGDNKGTQNFRLRNLSPDPLTISLQLINSETAPNGQTPIAGIPPILVRGGLNLTNLTYGYTNLPVSSTHTWTLNGREQEGSEVEVVLGLDRAVISGNVGDLLAGVLRFTDSLGHSRMDVPLSANVSSTAGLWVGGAAVTQVGQYLKSYDRTGDDLVVLDSGQYVVTGIDTNLTGVPTPFPLRLIVHSPSSGAAVLLQRVYFGLDDSINAVVTTRESLLNRDFISEARRISAAQLPWSESNDGWQFSDLLGQGATLTASVTNKFDDHASSPFLHTYHPDHDNMDARFSNEQPQGAESYTVIRDITLNVMPPGNDFNSRTSGDQTLTGNYLETIRMLGLARAGGTHDTRQFEVRGVFTLNHVSDIPTLTTP